MAFRVAESTEFLIKYLHNSSTHLLQTTEKINSFDTSSISQGILCNRTGKEWHHCQKMYGETCLQWKSKGLTFFFRLQAASVS
jgi:hypothetical protein